MRAIVLCFLMAIFATAAAAAKADETGTRFDQWQTSCRPDGYCMATTGPSDAAAGHGFGLHIGRPARQSYWEIGVAMSNAVADPKLPIAVTVGKRSFEFVPPHDVASYGAVNDYYFLGKQAQRLFDALMVPGPAVTLAFTDRQGTPHRMSFALAGIAPALLSIDRRQHRIGSERVAETPPFDLGRVLVVAPAPTPMRPGALDPDDPLAWVTAPPRSVKTMTIPPT